MSHYQTCIREAVAKAYTLEHSRSPRTYYVVPAYGHNPNMLMVVSNDAADRENPPALSTPPAMVITDTKAARGGAMKPADTAKFYWNGIKVGGKLYRAWYGFDRSNGVIHITARSYADGLPGGIGLEVRNDTRIEVDYFAHSKAAVGQDHPLFPAVLEAVLKGEARDREQAAARIAKATTASMHK